MRNKLFILLIAAVLFLSACSSTPTVAPTPTLDPIAKQGQAVFNARCATCHALVPDTIIIGPSLAMALPPAPKPAWKDRPPKNTLPCPFYARVIMWWKVSNNVMITDLARRSPAKR